MKRAVANLLAHHRLMQFVWWAYPRRLRLWLFMNADRQ